MACPLLEGIDLSGAKGVLVLITAAKGSLKLSESKLAMNTIRAYASPDAHVIYGTAYDDDLGDEMRVTVVATGLSRQGAAPHGAAAAGAAHRHRQRAVQRADASAPWSAARRGTARPAQPDYDGMAVPSVWRTNRTQAAAKVDALSGRHGRLRDSGVPAQAGGLTGSPSGRLSADIARRTVRRHRLAPLKSRPCSSNEPSSP